MKAPTPSASCFAAFHRAVLDLNEEPTPLNVRRYLAASELLERQVSPGRRNARRAARPTGGLKSAE
jgi:N-formylglutamate amidohydrolase